MSCRTDFRQFAAIDADVVAKAMAALVGAAGEGRHIHFNRALIVLAHDGIIRRFD